MQIVIDIPKERFEKIKALDCGDMWGDTIYIRKGTPLPEHHGRLIEDCFSDEANNNNWHTVFNDDTGCYENVVLLDDIKSAPTIIPATGNEFFNFDAPIIKKQTATKEGD